MPNLLIRSFVQVASFLALASALPAQIIPNPSFEADTFTAYPGYASDNGGSISGWTISGTLPIPSGSVGLNPAGGSPFADNGLVPDGDNVAFLQAINSQSRLATTITGLTPGVVYEVSFRADSRIATAAPEATWSLNGGAFVPFAASAVGLLGNTYQTIIGSFTATATHADLVIANQTVADSAVLVDDFRIAARQIPGNRWTVSRWGNDASTALSPDTTRWAYHFSSTTLANINGVTFIGLPGGNPSVANRFTISGVGNTFDNHYNQLTVLGGIGSAVLANNFIYNGNPATITVQGLTPGQDYRVSLFSVGFDTGAREQTFGSDGDQRVIDENLYGVGNGLRVDYSFTATNTTQVITITPVGGATFHLYGLALTATWPFSLNGASLLTNECHTAYTELARTGARTVAAGALHNLALRSDGTVAAWGSPNFGQTTVPMGLNNVVAIAAGYYHSLALKSDGTVAAWGRNVEGQTNIPAGLSKVVAIAGGGVHSLALKSDGAVAAWGGNDNGQATIPVGLNNVMAIAGGGYHSLALKSDGTVAAWGRNVEGQTSIPVGLSDVVAIAGGYYYSLALKSDGTVAVWGLSDSGQTTIPVGLNNVVAIAGGGNHSLALKSDGTVTAWGGNVADQTTIPVGLSDVVAIAGGFYHSLALKSDGTVAAWGRNVEGQTSIPASVYLPAGISGSVDTNTPGSYTLSYIATNIHGDIGSATRTVVVQDTLSPVLTLNGQNLIILNNHSFTDPGAAAVDLCAGNLTVAISNRVNVNFPGIYTNTYTAVDGFGHVVTTNRTVVVAVTSTVPGDLNGDAIVDQSELNIIYGSYVTNSPWLHLTNVAGLGGTNVTFALANSVLGAFTVEYSTNLTNWQPLGPATPRYGFTDTNAPALPQRHYRLRYP